MTKNLMRTWKLSEKLIIIEDDLPLWTEFQAV